MPNIKHLPDPSTWKHVLVHRFIRHNYPIKVDNHRTSEQSFLSYHHGEVVPTVTTNDPYLAQRATKVGGWLDITPEIEMVVEDRWDKKKKEWRFDEDGTLPWERKVPAESRVLPVELPGSVPVSDEVDITGSDDRPAPVKRVVRGAAARKPSSRPRK